jgi:hypothetical protein
VYVNHAEAVSAPAAPAKARIASRALASARAQPGLLVTAAVWVLFVLNFNALRLSSSDEGVQLQFVQRLFGDMPHAVAYYFGLGIAEAPLYAIGKLLRALGSRPPATIRSSRR